MASITINFIDTTLASSNCSVLLTGGLYVLNVSEPVAISGTVTFNSLYITASGISFDVTSGTTFDATISANVTSTVPGTAPEIEVTNFVGTVTVDWPTAVGLETQMLPPGDPLTLSGYVG